MRVRGLGRLKRMWRWVTAPFCSKAIILLYHRVFDACIDPQLLCVTPKNFAFHMEHLRRHYHVISLRELRQALLEGTLPKRVIVVTFDDGYADNLWNAKPILEHYEIPATVFVSTGYVGQKCGFWWDELERLLLHPGQVPRTLRLIINNKLYEWNLGDPAKYPPSEFERYRDWHVLMKEDPTPRHQAYRDLHRLLRSLPEVERRQVLNQLRSWVSVDENSWRDYRPLSSTEILDLTRDGLVEVGAHTVNHPVLAALSVEEQRYEILESKRFLEVVLGHPVIHFAYPYGSLVDYTPQTVALVREAGFEDACSNFNSTVSINRRLDIYQLPRFLVRNWTKEEFAQKLARQFQE
jgi:peptidoglycan/xylan/chitin deacetylase (PgdA/CDA1 family)